MRSVSVSWSPMRAISGNRDRNIIQRGDAGFVGGHPNGLAGGGGQRGENKRGGGHT